jgi:hypothetical protein
MGAVRKLVVVLLAMAGVALAIPHATAQVPELPPGTVPPEVTGAIADAIAQLPNPIIPAVDGVGGASATPGHAEASVVDVPDAVTVGKSETSKDGSKVTILNVGGTDVLVRNGDANGGTYSGEAAALGDALDQANGQLCPNGPGAGGNCAVLLYSDAKTDQPVGTSKANTAKFRALAVSTDQGPESLTVGATDANTIKTPFFGTTRCTDIATSFILAGGGQLAAVYLLNPGGPVNGAAVSAFKAC